MKQKTGIRQGCIAALVLVVTLTGCGASSDVTSSTETSLAEMPLCAALESNLERILLRYTELAVEVESFRSKALLPSGSEKQIADWYCEMSERFPGQMSFVGYEEDYIKRPIEFFWGLKFLESQFGVGNDSWWEGKVEKPWGNPNTYADDVFPGCEPGLVLRTLPYTPTKFPKGSEFYDTVASGAIRALKNGTFDEYQRASKEEWELTFASDLLYPPTRADPSNGADQVTHLRERSVARLIDAGNLLYIKVVCPEIWAQLNTGGEGEPESYLDDLSAVLTQPSLKQHLWWNSWPTHRGVMWSGFYEQEIYMMTGCNFERLAFESTLKSDDPKLQGYLGFECGLDPDLASKYLRNRKKFAGPSFVYVYNDPASRDVAVQRKRASDYNFEYNVAYCGEVNFGGFLIPYVAYFKSADVLEKWHVWFFTSAEHGYGYSVEQIPEQIEKAGQNFRQC